jgi:hypothetical protein
MQSNGSLTRPEAYVLVADVIGLSAVAGFAIHHACKGLLPQERVQPLQAPLHSTRDAAGKSWGEAPRFKTIDA